mgnify:CR=1 FL=1
MKANLWFVSAICIVQFATAQEFKNAGEYLDYVGKIEKPISKDMWKYTKTVAHSKSAKRIDNVRKNLVKTIQTAKANLEKNSNGFNGDMEFRDDVIQYLAFSELMINEEYAKIVDLQEVAEQSYDFMEAYITTRELVNDKIDAEREKLDESQKRFATKYKINLIESAENSEIEKKMKISSEVFKYQSNMYLIFFKCNYTTILLDNAIKTKDLAAIQQNANALQQYSEEGLVKIDTFEPVKSDRSLANETKKSMETFQQIATDYASKMIDFYTFNSKFEDIKTSLERKSAKDRTNEEIDNYNKMVKEINTKINDFNKENENYVKTINSVTNNWNKASDAYISKHVPTE